MNSLFLIQKGISAIFDQLNAKFLIILNFEFKLFKVEV